MYIVAEIHNNSLGKVKEVESIEEGKDIARGWAEEQLQRDLTDEEIDGLENDLEIYDDSDCDNLWTFSIGMTE